MAKLELKEGDFITNGESIIKIRRIRKGEYLCGILYGDNLTIIYTIEQPGKDFKKGGRYEKYIKIRESLLSDIVIAQFRKGS